MRVRWGPFPLVIAMAVASQLIGAAAALGARVAYVTDSSTPGAVSALSIGSGGGLTPVGGSPFAAGARTFGVALTPDAKYLYATNNSTNNVSAFSVAGDGSLTPLSGSPFSDSHENATGPGGDAMTPDGKHLYVTNISGNSVSAFSIAADGRLTVVGSPAAVINSPAGVAVTPDGRFLYVTNQNSPNVSDFSIGSDGSLTPIGTTPSGGNTPFGVSVTPDGRHLYVADQSSAKIAAFSIGADGGLTAVAGSPFAAGPNASLIAIAPDGSRLYVTGVSPNVVYGFSVGADGSLTPLNGSPFAAGSQPQGVAVTPDGAHLYVANAVNSGTVTAFSIGADGSLSGVSGSPFAAGSAPLEIAVAPDQGPAAAFSASPAPEGSASILDGSGSADPDGAVARYDWNFGDGATASDGGATQRHIYATAGDYTVTLTVTDDEGCSTKQVYTGQTVLCNGGPAATIAHTVTVPKATPTVTTTTSSPPPPPLPPPPPPPSPPCGLAGGGLAGRHLGPLSLGLTRRRARQIIGQHSKRGQPYQEFFCLRPIGIRAGIASPKLLRTLPAAARDRLEGRVVWLSTANPRYAIHGVHARVTLAAARRELELGRRIRIGANDWYLGPAGPVTAVLKVRHGEVQEVGIAVRWLTVTRRQQAIFMGSFG